MTICVANHENTQYDIRTTVLHEAVHIVQACNNGKPLFSAKSLFNNISKSEVDFVLSKYPKDQAHTEIEARVISTTSGEEYITNLLIKYCLS